MDHEMEKFQKDLLASVRQMKADVSQGAFKGRTSTPSERSN